MEPVPIPLHPPVQLGIPEVPIQLTARPILLINPPLVPKPEPIAKKDVVRQAARRVALLSPVAKQGVTISLLKSLDKLQKRYGKA